MLWFRRCIFGCSGELQMAAFRGLGDAVVYPLSGTRGRVIETECGFLGVSGDELVATQMVQAIPRRADAAGSRHVSLSGLPSSNGGELEMITPYDISAFVDGLPRTYDADQVREAAAVWMDEREIAGKDSRDCAVTAMESLRKSQRRS